MWLLKSTHKHIDQETLSEYLDGRLRGKALARVEQRLEDCEACRLELDELRATVALVQQLPMEAPRRSFVMSAPPPEPARSRPALALRAPNWVYAGAASVAALALAITVSVDATGGLSSDPLRQDTAATARAPATATELMTIVSAAAETAPDAEATGAAPQLFAAATALPVPSDQAAQAEPTGGAAITSQAEAPPSAATDPTTTDRLAQEEPAVDAGGAPGGAAGAEMVPLATIAPATADQTVPENTGGAGATGLAAGASPAGTPPPFATPDSRAIAAVAPDATPLPQTAGTDGDDSPVGNQTAKALQSEIPVPVSEPAGRGLIDQGDGETSVWWRVFEVAAGLLAVAFFFGLATRWRANRRDSS